MNRVREINRIEQLGQYRPVWRALLERTAGATFFQSLEWLETYWKHFGAGQKLRTLVIGRDDRPQGILPLVVRREPTKLGRVRVLTYPLHDWGTFYGPIGPSPAETLSAGLAHLRSTRRDWDIVELRWLGAAGTDPTATERAMRTAGFQAYSTIWCRTSVIDLGGSWEAYLASRPAAWRNNFRRRQRKLAKLGELTFLRHRPAGRAAGDAEPRWDLYRACEQIAAKSWQGSATNGTTISHASVQPFLREAHAAAAEAGSVDLNLLMLDGKPLSFVYNYCHRGYVSGLRVGYDPEWSRWGVGMLLWGLSIRDSFRRGDRIYDMGPGSPDGKRRVQTDLIPVLRYSHYHQTALRAQLLRLKRRAEARALASGETPALPAGS